MLRPSDLSNHSDFRLGSLEVSPSTRRVQRDDSHVTLEPRMMQVLVLLARTPNQVVTRETLFEEIWGGAMVGDDSINRAIAGVRRAIELDAANLALETIPRTGYRLKVGETGSGDVVVVAPSDAPRFPRRAVVGGGVIAAGALGAGLWWNRTRSDREFEGLIERSEEMLLYGDPSRNPSDLLQRAVALRPESAHAAGLLAYALATRTNDQRRAASALPAANPLSRAGDELDSADSAARAALALDPTEPNARLAQTFVHQTSLDFLETENSLRDILKTAPNNVHVMKNYWNLLQCVGRSRDALKLVERALAIAPLAASVHYPWAQLLWITGREAEADRVIYQALQYWPAHRFVRFARFMILAFTGRPRAALAMIEDRDTAPQNFTPEMMRLWSVSLTALDRRTAANIAAAVDANMSAARADLNLTSYAAMALSALGKVDAAFELTNALFVVPDARSSTPGSTPGGSTAWRFAPWLFTPPIAALRADERFGPLCNTIGLTDYWEKRGVRPDFSTAAA
ncbi:MAG TPA: winged helix-turn-helix domain-containing protein [Sphingomicrobium sp.]|nr:winged helix-turn-helix domain-containing protein [Sphingomicrobium sp.]